MKSAEPKQPEDAYAGMAERYDRFHGPFGQHDLGEVTFFRTLIQENRVGRVLDCACGTGRHLHLLHVLGCEVVGSDISASMLAQAERNLGTLGVRVPLLQVDYRELPERVGGSYDAVLCLSSSILHMSSESQVLRAFRSMRSVLRPGGILVLTQGTTDKQWADKPRFVLAVNEQDFSRLFVIDYEGLGARYHVLDISHGEKSWGLEVWSVHYPRVYLRDDQERLLHEAGFERVAFYGTYGFDAYDKEASQRLIAVAWR